VREQLGLLFRVSSAGARQQALKTVKIELVLL